MAQQERKKDNIQSSGSRLDRAGNVSSEKFYIPRRTVLRGIGGLALGVLFGGNTLPANAEASEGPVGFEVSGEEFYNQTRGDAPPEYGYKIRGEFLQAYLKFNGSLILGFPVSQEFTIDGIRYQATQNAFLQKFGKEVFLANLADMLHEEGYDDALLAMGIPRHLEVDDGSNGQIEEARKIRAAWMNYSSIREMYYRNPNPGKIPDNIWDPVVFFGLPTSKPEKRGPFIAQRFQRTAILHWVENVPGGQPVGTVQFANLGDIAKQIGLIPREATIPIHKDTGEPWIKVPEVKYNFPPLPPNPAIKGPDDIENINRIFDKQIVWGHNDYPNGLRHVGGELKSWRVENNSVIITVLTDRRENKLYDLFIQPRVGHEFSFIAWRGQTMHLVFNSTDPTEAYHAMNFYLRNGYPVALGSKLRGDAINLPDGKRVWDVIFFYN